MCSRPPRSPTIVGRAVETIVWSSDASSITSSSAPMTTPSRRALGSALVTAMAISGSALVLHRAGEAGDGVLDARGHRDEGGEVRGRRRRGEPLDRRREVRDRRVQGVRLRRERALGGGHGGLRLGLDLLDLRLQAAEATAGDAEAL